MLKELLELADNKPVHMNLEFKTNEIHYDNIEQIVLDMMKQYTCLSCDLFIIQLGLTKDCLSDRSKPTILLFVITRYQEPPRVNGKGTFGGLAPKPLCSHAPC